MKHNPPSHTTSPCTEAMSNAVQAAAGMDLDVAKTFLGDKVADTLAIALTLTC